MKSILQLKTLQKPVPFALITSQNGDSLGITDKDGIALVKIKQKVFPFNLFINISGLQKPLTISSVPSAEEVEISINSGLLIQLEDKSGPVADGARFITKYLVYRISLCAGTLIH